MQVLGVEGVTVEDDLAMAADDEPESDADPMVSDEEGGHEPSAPLPLPPRCELAVLLDAR